MGTGGRMFWRYLSGIIPLLLWSCAGGHHGADAGRRGSSDAGLVRDAGRVRDAGLVRDARTVPTGADASTRADAARGNGRRMFLEVPDVLGTLPKGDELRDRLCERQLQDPIAKLFCQTPAPQPSSMTELLSVLKLEPSTTSNVQGFALTGHSTALSKRFVSAINPRVVYARLQDGTTPPLSVAFTRGEPFVEAVTVDPTDDTLQFYIIAFALPCEDSPSGCGTADLLTLDTEAGWLSVDVYHERDFRNTTLDCAVCHQPGGPGTSKLLRMQELENTWTHWLFNHSRGGRALTSDFLAAHSGEPYGGLPPELLDGSRPAHLAELVRARGPFVQPNMFVSGRIEIEVETHAQGQPEDNSIAGDSAVWRRLFEEAQRGTEIPVPYHDVKVTDATKLAAMTAQYHAYLEGRLPADELPDIRDVFPEDSDRLIGMGFLVDDKLRGQALLTAACAMCHNRRLDQGISRAKFHTELSRLTRAQKDVAIRRLQLPPDHLQAMPPVRIHSLTDATRARLIELLR